MFQSVKAKALLVVPLIVIPIVSTFFALGYFVALILGIPITFGLILPVRLIGLFLLVSGFFFFGWVFRYRTATDVLVSTYVTFSKVKKRSLSEKPMERTEPLVIQGPYRYVRHPLYFGIVGLVFDWWLLLDYSFLLVSGIFLLLWLNFIATIEEVELKAIFGEQYERYSNEVPKLIPFTKYRKK